MILHSYSFPPSRDQLYYAFVGILGIMHTVSVLGGLVAVRHCLFSVLVMIYA